MSTDGQHPLVGRIVLYKGRMGVVAGVQGKVVDGKEVARRVVIKVGGGHAAQDQVVECDVDSKDWRVRYPESPQQQPPPPSEGTVWVAEKPGDERRYASAQPFATAFAEGLLAEGYEIFRVAYDRPERFCRAGYAVKGTAMEGRPSMAVSVSAGMQAEVMAKKG